MPHPHTYRSHPFSSLSTPARHFLPFLAILNLIVFLLSDIL